MLWGLWSSYLEARPCPGPRLPGSSEDYPSSPANCKLLSLKVQHLSRSPLRMLQFPPSSLFASISNISIMNTDYLIMFLLLHVLSHFSHVRLFATPWTVALQAPLSMGFSRQEYWSGLPLPPPGDLPNPGIQPTSLKSPTLAGGFFTTIAKT